MTITDQEVVDAASHVDMRSSNPCAACDFIGPELPTLDATFRGIHRAAHECSRTLANIKVKPVDLIPPSKGKRLD